MAKQRLTLRCSSSAIFPLPSSSSPPSPPSPSSSFAASSFLCAICGQSYCHWLWAKSYCYCVMLPTHSQNKCQCHEWMNAFIWFMNKWVATNTLTAFAYIGQIHFITSKRHRVAGKNRCLISILIVQIFKPKGQAHQMLATWQALGGATSCWRTYCNKVDSDFA